MKSQGVKGEPLWRDDKFWNIKRITRLLVFELGWLFFQPFGLRARYLFHGRKGNAIFASVSKTPMATVKGYHSYPLFIVAVAVTFVATLWKTVPIFCFLVSKAHAVFFLQKNRGFCSSICKNAGQGLARLGLTWFGLIHLAGDFQLRQVGWFRSLKV